MGWFDVFCEHDVGCAGCSDVLHAGVSRHRGIDFVSIRVVLRLMSVDDLLYSPIKKDEVDAVCTGCQKQFTYNVNDPFPPYCSQCKQNRASTTESCCVAGECSCGDFFAGLFEGI